MRPYSIQKSPAGRHHHIYYAKFLNESGAYLTVVSTGCTRRDDAVRWCEARFRDARERKESNTLEKHAEGFWSPEAPFALGRAAHGQAFLKDEDLNAQAVQWLEQAANQGFGRPGAVPAGSGERVASPALQDAAQQSGIDSVSGLSGKRLTRSRRPAMEKYLYSREECL
jgi:hypothetical protein